MFKLTIDKVIGEDWWGKYTGASEEISSAYVRDTLASFPDNENELRIVIDSPGGDVFEGITIFNIIREFARDNPKVKITTYIQGLAASMASVIALAASSVNPEQNKVEAEDNSVFMIHNAWDIVAGNKNDLRDAADFLSQIDNVLAATYVKKSGKTEKEIAAMMDAETWLWGKEIMDAGFADIVLDVGSSATKDESFVSARGALTMARKKMQTVAAAYKTEGRDFRAAALAMGFKGGLPSASLPNGEEKNRKGGCMKMTAQDLKRDNPEVYNEIVAEGEAAGIAKEQARASRLLAMGEKSGAKDYALDCIKNGSDPADPDVVDEFMDKGAAGRALAAQAADPDVPGVNLPKNDKNADKNAVMAAFDRETGADKWDK